MEAQKIPRQAPGTPGTRPERSPEVRTLLRCCQITSTIFILSVIGYVFFFDAIFGKKDTPSSEGPLQLSQYMCWEGFVKFPETGFCYKKFYERTDFDGAKKVCEEYGSLVSIHSEVENNFVAELSVDENGSNSTDSVVDNNDENEELWIGLHYNSSIGKWKWTDGTPVDYFKWATGEPNQLDSDARATMVTKKLADYSPEGKHWNNANESTRRKGFVCKSRQYLLMLTNVASIQQ